MMATLSNRRPASMHLPRAIAGVAASVAGVGLLGGCGQDTAPRERSAADVIEATLSPAKAIGSGVLDLNVELGLVARDSDTETIVLEGPFQSEAPQYDLALDIDQHHDGSKDSEFRGGFVGTDASGYIDLDGTSYEIDPAVFGRLKGASHLSRQTLQRWILDPVNEGDEEVDGVETIHVAGAANVAQIVADLRNLAIRAGLKPGTFSPRREDFEEAAIDLFVGADDSFLRRVELHLSWRGRLEGRERFDGKIDVALNLSEINREQQIVAPENPQPIGAFVDKAPLELSGLAEFLSGGPARAGTPRRHTRPGSGLSSPTRAPPPHG